MSPTPQEYEAHAAAVADALNLRVTVFFEGPACPPWGAEPGKLCTHMHGDQYRVYVDRRDTSKRLTFDFWNSKHDKDSGARPSLYDVLTIMGSDASLPTSADAVAEELGPMSPSLALRIARHACKLRAFFTDDERARLAEVQ